MTTSYNPKNQHKILELMALIRPLSMRTQKKIRLGNDYDGGYVVPEIALACDAVISIGVGPDVSFDLALAQRGAKIIQFDHTVEKSPADHPAFSFYKQGWGASTQGEFLSLADIAAKLPPTAQRKLLKFDIEGGEYESFANLGTRDILDYEVICCELHDFQKLADPVFYNGAHHLLATLHVTHAPVHLHANNYSTFVMVEGVPIPNVVEISYLRRDLDSFGGYANEPIPGPLDRPNHPYKPDLCLNPL